MGRSNGEEKWGNPDPGESSITVLAYRDLNLNSKNSKAFCPNCHKGGGGNDLQKCPNLILS